MNELGVVAVTEAVAVVVDDVAVEFAAVAVVVVIWETMWFFGLQYCVKRSGKFKGIFLFSISMHTLACGGIIPIVSSGSDW